MTKARSRLPPASTVWAAPNALRAVSRAAYASCPALFGWYHSSVVSPDPLWLSHVCGFVWAGLGSGSWPANVSMTLST